MLNLEDRLWKHISPEPNTGCWLWDGALDRVGYGIVGVGDKVKKAHRISFEIYKGPIPAGLFLDHLCRQRSCVNPDHLEPVTTQENLIRGHQARGTRAVMRQVCKNGHAMTAENAVIRGRNRVCRECERENSKRYRAKFALTDGVVNNPKPAAGG